MSLMCHRVMRNPKIFSKYVIVLSKNNPNIYHHIGIYSYEVRTLKKFISFSQTKNELKHNLEQLRALDNGININVMLAKKSPIGIDTQKDYLAIKEIMKYKI